MWHDETSELQEQGKLRMLGIIQEQHPDRARLFMQWKQMDWPVLVDSLDLLRVSYVPITLLIDEHGVVRGVVAPGQTPSSVLGEFLRQDYTPPATAPRPAATKDGASSTPGSAEQWSARADELFVAGPEKGLSRAIEAYGRAIAMDPGAGWTRFRAGVAYRARADSAERQPGDFANSVAAWSAALRLDPNNYIWRRRIQQYGPRLDKPYPFYDWVDRARREIEARGETPAALGVEPRGAELALPARSFAADGALEHDRERDERIQRDAGKLVRIEPVVVPPAVRPGGSARIHLELRPDAGARAHWNNEVAGLVVRVEPPAGWQVDHRRIELENPAARLGAISDETRRVEFEVRSPQAAARAVDVPVYALYYVCQGLDGACSYRRQDVDLRIDIAGD